MARPSAFQDAAIDVMDRLFFNQILVLCAYGDSERDWLKQIVDGVCNAVRETGATGIQAECLKHGVLCLMEIQMSDDMDKLEACGLVQVERPARLSEEVLRQAEKFSRDFFQAFVIAMLEQVYGESMAPALQIATTLAHANRRAPATVRYRLAERCFAHEFRQAPVDCLRWMAKTGIIVAAKYPPEKLTELPSEEVFVRCSLLCEFEMFRNYVGRSANGVNIARNAMEHSAAKLSEDTIDVLLDQAYRIEKINCRDSLRNTVQTFNAAMVRDPAYIIKFYSEVNRFCTRFRIWQGTLASWLGALGAASVEVERSLNHSIKPIYRDFDNTGTITDDVTMKLLGYGLPVQGRSVYKRHREFSEKLFRQVQIYFQQLDTIDVSIPAQHEDLFYYALVTNTADL